MKWASQLHRLAKISQGADACTLQRLYLSIAVPHFAYAADVWYTPVDFGSGKERSTGSVGMAKRLGRIKSTAARTILGAMRSTPIDALDAHAGLLPIHILLNEACQRSATRLASIASSHPLSKAVKQSAKGRGKHIPPLQQILQFAGHLPSEFNTAPANIVHHTKNQLLTPFPDLLPAIMKAHTDGTHTQVFSDGASSSQGVGAAAVLFSGRHRAHTVGRRLGAEGQISVVDAELIGVWMVVHLIIRSAEVIEAVIFMDSQLAIKALDGMAVGALPSPVASASLAIRNTRRRAGGIRVRLEWCPGHAGISGSSIADSEVRKAAAGQTTGADLLPGKVVAFKPKKNAKMVKEDTKKQNIRKASEYWLLSAAGIKLCEKYPSLLAHTSLDRVKKLPRARATLLFQLSVGHAPLQAHLCRLRAVETQTCPHCNEAPETVAHFICRCQAFAAARHQHLTSRGLEFLNLSFLFTSSTALSPLFSFIRAMNRFPDVFLWVKWMTQNLGLRFNWHAPQFHILIVEVLSTLHSRNSPQFT
jgi:ribonuclease HI